MLAPGSLLVVTHAAYEGIPLTREEAGGTVGVYQNIRNPLVMRNREEIEGFFDGFELVEPGLVPMPEWRPREHRGAGERGPVRLLGHRGSGTQGVSIPAQPSGAPRTRHPTAPRDRLRRFATIWSRAIFRRRPLP